MPVECVSIRSMARYVFPVLVGPRRAVTARCMALPPAWCATGGFASAVRRRCRPPRSPRAPHRSSPRSTGSRARSRCPAVRGAACCRRRPGSRRPREARGCAGAGPSPPRARARWPRRRRAGAASRRRGRAAGRRSSRRPRPTRSRRARRRAPSRSRRP